MHALLWSVFPTLHRPPPTYASTRDSWTLMGMSGPVSSGHWSFLLRPGAHKVLFVPSKSLFPQSCVSSGGSMVGLMATSSKRAYATPRSAAPRAPTPGEGHCWPVPPPGDTQTRFWLGLCGLGMRSMAFPGLSSSGNQFLASPPS